MPASSSTSASAAALEASREGAGAPESRPASTSSGAALEGSAPPTGPEAESSQAAHSATAPHNRLTLVQRPSDIRRGLYSLAVRSHVHELHEVGRGSLPRRSGAAAAMLVRRSTARDAGRARSPRASM